MKKTVILITLIVCFLFSACSSGREKLINAENYEGMALEHISLKTANSSKKPQEDETIPKLSETTSMESLNFENITKKTKEIQTAENTKKAKENSASSSYPLDNINSPNIPTTASASSAPNTDQTETPFLPGTSSYAALNHDQVYGIWISYLELGGILMGKSESSFRNSFSDMMDKCTDFGINTAFVQVRPFGDALYQSEFFPWSKYAGGNIGTSPGFDPLKIMIEEAHNRNISVHAWINPLRLSADADMMKINDKYETAVWYNGVQKGDYIVKFGDNWYLNPAYKGVRNLIALGASELTANYNLDGLHIDDYFYPTTDASFDEKSFKESGSDSLSEFRFDNINKLVKEIKKSVKTSNSSALFGISPQGSIENNINNLYADVNRWGNDISYCDYIAPQIYYGFDNQTQPYEECLSRWEKLTQNSEVKLIVGLAAYKIGKEDQWAGTGKAEWQKNSDILARQISLAKQKGSFGISFFSYDYLFGSEAQSAAVISEKNEIKKES
ncbi:MAG: family 10 glycosylhydrolase [Eubacterium sp.]|nr:family 10 glycosylhydrolase [Eubacterium sp.]